MGLICCPCSHSWFLEKRLSLSLLRADVSSLQGKARRDCMYLYQRSNGVVILHIKIIKIFVVILICRAEHENSHLDYRHLNNA